MGKKKFVRQSNVVPSGSNAGDMEESFEQLMAQSFQPARVVEVGDEVEAKVIGFDNDYIYLDLGTRLDGVVKKAEFMIKGKLTVAEGDIVNIFVTGQQKGVWQCSGRFGSGDTEGVDTHQTAALMALEEAFNRNIPVEGRVVTAHKGGFEVEVMGVKTFCPISHINKTYCDNPEEHLNQVYTFEIIRFEEEGNNIIVSRREFLAHEAEKNADKMWRELDETKIYDGTVTAVRDFGAFIDIGGIEGLLHISEIAYERLEKTEDVLSVGEKLKVSIKTIDREMRKVSFSRKSLLEDPWVAAVKKLVVGQEYQGKVVRMKPFGAFVELFPGVDGMVHISRLGTDRRHQHPKEVLKVGDVVTVRVLELDEPNRKISLTMEKQETDFNEDLKRMKQEQDAEANATPSKISNLMDAALKKDEE